jgi:outer membrane protein assembly factor BamD (BamD/ComL family)
MSSEGSRRWLMLACAASLLGGCATVPPVPQQAQAQKPTKPGEDEYEGWLWKSLTGKKTGDSAQATGSASATPSGVQQVSASMPAEASPWIAGPASPPPRGSSAKSEGGPPPMIPAELPAPPAGGVSIGDIKPKAETKKGFELSDLAPENIWKNAKNATGYGPDEKIARAAMQEGKTLFDAKKYKEAAAKFATAADRWPDTPLEEDALFLKGESEYFSDQYPKAHDTYGGLMKKYSNTRHLDTVVAREFYLGRYWEQLYDKNPTWPVTPNVTDKGKPLFDTFGYAIQAYERVRLNDPTGPLADDSLLALANAYFRHGQYENAAYNYDLLMKEYPNSEHQAKAHVLGLQAKMRIYQGTMYIGAPLNEAKKIADQTLTQYGGQLGEEKERVAKARAQIVEEQANREFVLAQYYENHKYYGAARMYYQGVIDEYPGTEKAKTAREQMEKIRSLPDTPPNHFSWLTGMFESKK